MSHSEPVIIASRQGRLIPNPPGHIPVAVPRDMPGVVIFLHGVNDPGAAYESVETGLCQGLNERLDRPDLRAGNYGADYVTAKAVPEDQQRGKIKQVLDDPDTYLYKRSADDKTCSLLIPFYWGYRAAPDEIKRDENGDPSTYRTQFQDRFNNRLDRHFAKGGGFFANATNNLLEMYRKGFNKQIRHFAQTQLSNPLYMGEGPHRRYFVLAAHRLAMLVSEIRRVSPDETVTIMGHSQGTLITLLAQALLIERGERCADCAIMVASPYSVLPAFTPDDSQTLQTLIDIVRNVTQAPHTQPLLDALRYGQNGYGGRTGPRWTPKSGQRLGNDQSTVVFPERDNRGKVYLYFSHDDTTVGLRDVSGIGTLGVAPELPDGTPAMLALHKLRFFQRLWSKRQRDGEPVMVGTEPGQVELRAKGENRTAMSPAPAALTQAGMAVAETRFINGEALSPPHAPQMFGGEAITGTPNKAGKDSPDAVSQNAALGNPSAKFHWFEVRQSPARVDLEEERARWNVGKEPEDQTQAIRQIPVSGNAMLDRKDYYRIEREETAREIRARMPVDPKEWDDNSYHSAILRSPENHRWVTAMDVAIGQAHCLDHPHMREVLIAIADWKMDVVAWTLLQAMPGWSHLSSQAQALVEANYFYYQEGAFPSKELVPMVPPSLVRGPHNKGAGL